MEKLCSLLLCLTLLALVGCGAANVPAPTPSGTPDSSEPQKTPEPIVSGTDEPATFATKDAEMLIYSPTEGGMIDAVHLTWHVQRGEVSFNTPICTLDEENLRSILAWNGTDTLLVTPAAESAEYDPTYTVEVYGAASKWPALWGDGYSLEFRDDGAVLTVADGENVSFDADKPLVTDSGEIPTLFGDPVTLDGLKGSVLASAYEDGVLTLVSFHSRPDVPNDSVLLCTKLYASTGMASCSLSLRPPAEFLPHFFSYPESAGHAIVKNVFYFSGQGTIGCLDLTTGEFFGLESVHERLRALVPEDLADSAESELNVVCGYTENGIIGHTWYGRSNHSDDKRSCSLYYCVEDGRLVGALCLKSDGGEPYLALNCYDSSLNPVGTVDLAEAGLPCSMVGFEWHHY